MAKKLACMIIAVFSLIMVYVLAVSTYLLKYFPIWSAGDLPIHIANIFFLDNYGFHGIVPNWYNGIVLFELYSPGFSYLGLMLYKLFSNYLITIYLSLVVIYLIGFFGIYLISRNQKFNRLKMVLFFLAFFFNYVVSIYAIRTGRFPELLAWSIFILFFYVIIEYKDQKLDYKVLLLPIFYALLMLTHIYVFTVASVLLLSILVVKPNKERLMIILLVILALAATSFWWLQFFDVSQSIRDGAYNYGVFTELLGKSSIISTNTLFCVLFIILFVLYAIEKNKDATFYVPILLLDLLLLTRLIYFIPIFRNVPTTPYNVFFAFISLFLFFKLKNPRVKKFALLGLLIFSLFSLLYVANIETRYSYSEIDEEFFSLISHIDGRYFILDEQSDVYHEKLAAYSAAYYNLSTPIGYFREYESLKYLDINGKKILLKDELDMLRSKFNNSDCTFTNDLNDLGVDEIIVNKEKCGFVKDCNLTTKKETQNLCLFTVQHS